MINIATRLVSLFLILSFFATCSDVNAAGRYGRMGYGGGGYDGLGTIYQLEHADKQLKERQRELIALREKRNDFQRLAAKVKLTAAERAALQALSNEYVDLAGLDAEIHRQADVLAKLETQITQLATGRPQITAGQLVAKGIAGMDDFYMFDNARVDSLWDGIQQGFILGTAKEFGDFVRTKMRGVFQDKLGVLFDSTVNGITDGFERIKEVLFHDSKRPFSDIEVGAWQGHIRSVFDEIERITKDGLRDAYRSQDMTMRQTGATNGDDLTGMPGDDTKEQPSTIAKAPVRIWADLFGGYVLQLSYYILILQDRKGYYALDSFEVFFATHLEERLQQFCNLLIKVNDLADLDTYLAANKAVIPAYKSNVDNLFKQLQQQVKTRTFTTTQNATSLFERDKPRKGNNRYADDYDVGMNGYPQSGWDGR